VIQRIAALIVRMGDRTPYLITSRDGSEIEGVPTSIQTNDRGGVEVTLREFGNNNEKRI